MGSRASNIAIVPAHNEEASVASVVAAIKHARPDFDVLVIDDGSSDRTASVAVNAGAQVLIHPFNLGIGGAMQSGYRYARDHGHSLAVQIDADGQHDPALIGSLIDAMAEQNVDLVCGSRFVDGHITYKAPFTRRLGIRMFAGILSLIGHRRITDPTSGFRLCNRHAIELFANDYPCDYPEVEAVVMLKAHELTMTEVPVHMNQRLEGESSINWTRSAYYVVKVLLAVFMRVMKKRPLPADDSELLTA